MCCFGCDFCYSWSSVFERSGLEDKFISSSSKLNLAVWQLSATQCVFVGSCKRCKFQIFKLKSLIFYITSVADCYKYTTQMLNPIQPCRCAFHFSWTQILVLLLEVVLTFKGLTFVSNHNKKDSKKDFDNQ